MQYLIACGWLCRGWSRACVCEFETVTYQVRALQTAWCGGGNAANTAAALARLGSRARLLTKAGSFPKGSVYLYRVYCGLKKVPFLVL